jgi:hypothetical protein
MNIEDAEIQAQRTRANQKNLHDSFNTRRTGGIEQDSKQSSNEPLGISRENWSRDYPNTSDRSSPGGILVQLIAELRGQLEHYEMQMQKTKDYIECLESIAEKLQQSAE